MNWNDLTPQLKARLIRENPQDINSQGIIHHETPIPNRHPRTTAKLEPDSSDGAVGAVQVQERTSPSVLVRVTSYRRRLLDEDNLCAKYVVDLCRYAGILRTDSPCYAKIEVCQEKVRGKEAKEFTRIEIMELP